MLLVETDFRQVSWFVPSRSEAVSYVRHRAVAEVRAWGVGRDDLLEFELVVTELVTNAVVHAGGSAVGVSLRTVAAGAVVIRVSDSCPGFVSGRARRDGDEHGRGLVMVRRLAPGWWWEPLPDGKVVCAVVDVRGRGGWGDGDE
ncbi:ATP-binding protein [Kitasatospora sp. NBC_00458]|uniref:ATP-binding protein n=1 Tax=Kitasatospora sp. NBC_00458 TaxID=2903568 RepID=UPI002E17D3EF